MLDLQARIDFQKIKIEMGVDQKLNRSGVYVATGAREADGSVSHFPAQLRRHDERGSLLNYFLMAALNGTFALAKRDDTAVGVGKDLHFDVAGFFQIFFEIEASIAESVQSFRGRIPPGGGKFGIASDDAHAFAAAAGDGFEQHGIAHVLSEGLRILGILNGIVCSGNGGHIGTASELAAGSFRAEGFHGFGARADEGDASIRTGSRECRVFGKKPVSRMDSVAAGAARNVDYFVNAKIAFARRGRADGVSLVGKANVKRLTIDVAENRGGTDAQLSASAQDAHGNFTAIGNQDFPEHEPFATLRDFSMR